MGWWNRLFGRSGAGEPPRPPALEAAEPAAAEPENEGEISPVRLDDALRRLRDEIPAPDEAPGP